MRGLFDSVPVHLKRCRICKEFKTFDCFSPDLNRRDRLATSCKPCNCKVAKDLSERYKSSFSGRPAFGNFRCIRCKELKDVSEFNTERRRKNGIANTCRDCARLRKKQWDDHNKATGKNAEIIRVANIKRKLSSAGEYDRMLNEQNGLCAICFQKPQVTIRNGKPGSTGTKPLFIDHCHKTGKIRGLLCHYCNISLGSFKDNVDYLQSAIEYLKKHA